MNNFAHLKKDSPWYPIFDRGMAPIKNIIVPSQGNMIGGGGVQDFYDLDLSKLTPEQEQKIFEMVARQCGTTAEEARQGIKAQGGRLPLRAIHVTSVSSDSRAF